MSPAQAHVFSATRTKAAPRLAPWGEDRAFRPETIESLMGVIEEFILQHIGARWEETGSPPQEMSLRVLVTWDDQEGGHMQWVKEVLGWTDQDMDDVIVGAGAQSGGLRPWWLSVTQIGEGYRLGFRDGDGNADAVSISRDDVAEVMFSVVSQKWSEGYSNVARQIVVSDLDALAVDLILQLAVFGRVVYT